MRPSRQAGRFTSGSVWNARCARLSGVRAGVGPLGMPKEMCPDRLGSRPSLRRQAIRPSLSLWRRSKLMKKLTRVALLVPALALVAVFATRASASLPTSAHTHATANAALDPDPADCPFCGGSASVHVERMNEL